MKITAMAFFSLFASFPNFIKGELALGNTYYPKVSNLLYQSYLKFLYLAIVYIQSCLPNMAGEEILIRVCLSRAPNGTLKMTIIAFERRWGLLRPPKMISTDCLLFFNNLAWKGRNPIVPYVYNLHEKRSTKATFNLRFHALPRSLPQDNIKE